MGHSALWIKDFFLLQIISRVWYYYFYSTWKSEFFFKHCTVMSGTISSPDGFGTKETVGVSVQPIMLSL